MDEAKAQQLVTEFIDKLGVQVESIESQHVAGQQIFAVQSTDSKRLIGPRGDHLRALNYILRRLAETRREGDEEYRFMVDVNGYQLNRIRELEQKAKLLADRVRTFKSSAEMTPMSAYERMIIHSLFAEDDEIVTESEGSGKVRHVILRYNTGEQKTA